MAVTGEPQVSMPRQIVSCAARTIRLLATRRLHLPRTHVGREVALPDGRRYVVFRESTCDAATAGDAPVMLAVWFRLRAIPPGARVRRRLFERLCIVNTLLFAGCAGYLVKLWMVNPATSDYAGLYSWSSAEAADAYGRYITAILRPFCCRGSTGFHVSADTTLAGYLDSATECAPMTVSAGAAPARARG
jgi:hypothetical protein